MVTKLAMKRRLLKKTLLPLSQPHLCQWTVWILCLKRYIFFGDFCCSDEPNTLRFSLAVLGGSKNCKSLNLLHWCNSAVHQSQNMRQNSLQDTVRNRAGSVSFFPKTFRLPVRFWMPLLHASLKPRPWTIRSHEDARAGPRTVLSAVGTS